MNDANKRQREIARGEFGEPWADYDNDLPRTLNRREYARAVACVNALEGLNPAGVRAAVDALEGIIWDAENSGGCTDGLEAAIADIKSAASFALAKLREGTA